MLRRMRGFAKSWIAIILFGLIIISFAIFGINDVMSWGARGDDVAQVGQSRIDRVEYAQTFRRTLDAMSEQSGRVITPQEAAENDFDTSLLQQMIDETLVLERAREMGMAVSDQQVARAIQAIPAFRDPVKQAFDQVTYERVLRDNGMTPAMFEQGMRDDLLRRQVMSAVAMGLEAPKRYVERRMNYLYESRDAVVAVVDARVIGAPPEATDEELAAFLAENPDPFRTPERRTISFVHFSLADAKANTTVPEDKIKELYEFRKDQLGTPETRTFEQIIVPDMAMGQQVADRLNAGEDAEAVALDLGLNEPLTQEGQAERDIADKTLAEKVFAANTGDVIGPIEGRLSTAVVKVTDIMPETSLSYDEAKADLKASLLNDIAAEAVLNRTQAFQDEFDAGGTMEESAKAAELAVQSLSGISANGMAKAGRPPEILLAHPEILTTAFEQAEGMASDIFPLKTGGYAIVRVDGITPEAVPPLDEIKSRVAQFWKANRMRELLEQKAQEVLVEAEKTGDLKAVAQAQGLPTETVSGLKRAEAMTQRVPPIVDMIFSARPGEVVTGMAGPLVMAVAQVTDLKPADIPADAPGPEENRQQLTVALTNDVGSQFLASARKDLKVRVYPDRARAAIGLEPEGEPITE